MLSTNFSPADAKLQQEEDRQRAIVREKTEARRIAASQADSARRTADATEILAKVALEEAKAAREEAAIADKRARKAHVLSVISVVVAVLSLFLSFLFQMGYLP